MWRQLFPNYIICVCLAIKAARHHFVAFLYSKSLNGRSLLCLVAVECSLLDEAFVECYSDLSRGAGGSCSAPGQGVRLCDLRDPSWLCPGNALEHKLPNHDILSQHFFS